MSHRLVLASLLTVSLAASLAFAQPAEEASESAEEPADDEGSAAPRAPEEAPAEATADEAADRDSDVEAEEGAGAETKEPAGAEPPDLPERGPAAPDEPPAQRDNEVAGEQASTEEPREEAEAAGAEDAEALPPEGLQEPIDADEKRPIPDYDNRGQEPISAGEVLIWIPRGIFYPLYLVSEYVLRWPFGKAITAVEKADLPDVVREIFTFGPRGNYGVVPSFLIDFGLRPSVGVYFFADDVGEVEGLGLRSHLAFGGPDWYRATASIRYQLEDGPPEAGGQWMQVKGIYSHRPDWQYWGQGPRTIDEHQSSYIAQYSEGLLEYQGGFWRSSWLRAEAGIRDARFKPGGCCSPRELLVAVDRGLFAKPESFDDGYLLAQAGLNGAIDTRPRRFEYEGEASDHVAPPGSGVKLAARGRFGGGLRETQLPGGEAKRPLFVGYGGTVGGYLDVYNQRVIGLQAIVDFVDPLGSNGFVPFTELVSLGGNRPMRGFRRLRHVDRSSAVAMLDYRWPIWVWLDGAIHYAVGNVFGEHLDDFEPDLLRQSFGVGFRANNARDHTFELLIAGGTRTFREGGRLENFRLVFGSTAGF